MNKFFARFSAILFTTAILLGLTNVPSQAAVIVGSSTPYTAAINGQSVWSGNLPNKLTFTDNYSAKIEFPITGLLPHATLADRLYGVEVEFELWGTQGKKYGYDTVYEFDWNPVGPETLVSIYASDVPASGTATLIARTIWTTRSNGLVSSYLKTETKQDVTFQRGSVPKAVKNLSGSWSGKSLSYKFSKPSSTRPIYEYSVMVQFISDNSLSPKSRSNFDDPSLLKSVPTTKFTIKKSEIVAAIRELGLASPKYFLITVVAVSEIGESDQSNGIYTLVKDLK